MGSLRIVITIVGIIVVAALVAFLVVNRRRSAA